MPNRCVVVGDDPWMFQLNDACSQLAMILHLVVIQIQFISVLDVRGIVKRKSIFPHAGKHLIREFERIQAIELDPASVSADPPDALDEITFVESSVQSPRASLLLAADYSAGNDPRMIRSVQEESRK